MKGSVKILILIVAGFVSFTLLSRDAKAINFWAFFQDGVAEIVDVLPWQNDPPPEECTCEDHEQCMGNMHGDGQCEPDCPMDMGECNMMGDCHGGGAPVAPQTHRK